MYDSHLINELSSTAIGRKTPLEVWSEKAAQDHDLLRENKKIVLSQHVTFVETSLLTVTISQ